MNTLSQRLSRLERSAAGGKGRLITISASSGNSEETISALLLANGIRRKKNDLVVVLKTFYEDRDGEVIVCDDPPVLLNVIPQV